MILALRILLVAVLQTVALVQMIYERSQILKLGTPITLKTQPVDPRDLFRGDYVTLNYEVSTLDLKQLEGDNRFNSGDDIYVMLEQRDAFWVATAAYRKRPGFIGNQVAMKGEVEYVSETRTPCPEENQACDYLKQPIESVTVRVDYHIDSYFVPEGDGKKIEAAIRDPKTIDRVAVEVAVDTEGTAAIKALILDGKVLYEEYIF